MKDVQRGGVEKNLILQINLYINVGHDFYSQYTYGNIFFFD